MQLFIIAAIASFTIARCRSRWQFILLAVWKLVIYAAAAVVGLVGLISLVVENFWIPGVWKITTVFGSLILGTGLACLALWWWADASGGKNGVRTHSKALLRGLGLSSLGVVPTLMLILAAFYSDWVLGALAGNLVGVPSGDNAYLYWVSY